MKTLERFKLVSISILLAIGLSACDKPGPAETAGKKIDQTTDKASEQLGAAANKAGVAIDDTEITAKVKAAIFAEPGLKTLQISVDTIKGVVTLSGSVDTPSNSDRTKALAGAVMGVKEVRNLLVVK